MNTTESLEMTLEQRLLGVLLVGNSAAVDIAISLGLTPEAFSDPRNREIFFAVLSAAASPALDREVNSDSVFFNLSAQYRSPGVYELMGNMIASEATTARLRILIDEVIGLGRRRKLARAAGELKEIAERPSEWSETFAEAASVLQRAAEIGQERKSRTIAEIVTAAEVQLDDRFTNKADAGVSSGLPGFDKLATKIKSDELIVLAARPSVGKSSFAGQITSHALHSGRRVAVFSLENSSESFVQRMCVQETGIPLADLFQSASGRGKFSEQMHNIGSRTNLHLFDDMHSLEQIESKCRMLAASGTLGLIAIDYLQLVTPPSDVRMQNREQQVATITRRLK
jgi:replicative DNA helicase